MLDVSRRFAVCASCVKCLHIMNFCWTSLKISVILDLNLLEASMVLESDGKWRFGWMIVDEIAKWQFDHYKKLQEWKRKGLFQRNHQNEVFHFYIFAWCCLHSVSSTHTQLPCCFSWWRQIKKELVWQSSQRKRDLTIGGI